MRRGKRAEPRIVDPATHPREWVSVTVAAEYLEEDPRAVSGLLDEGRIPFRQVGRRKKIRLADLLAFERSCSTRNNIVG